MLECGVLQLVSGYPGLPSVSCTLLCTKTEPFVPTLAPKATWLNEQHPLSDYSHNSQDTLHCLFHMLVIGRAKNAQVPIICHHVKGVQGPNFVRSTWLRRLYIRVNMYSHTDAEN